MLSLMHHTQPTRTHRASTPTLRSAPASRPVSRPTRSASTDRLTPLSPERTRFSPAAFSRNSSSNISTITGGTIASGTGELIVHAYSTLTIDSALSLPGGLTKTGTSPLILTGDNSGLTGPVTVNNGYLRFGSAQACEPLTSIRINNQNGNTGITFVLPDGQNASVAANISLAAVSDTFIFNFGLNSRVTLGGTISTAAGSGDLYFLPTNSPTSGFNLTGTNTFTNNVFLLGGVLGIGSDASLGNAANQLTLTSQYSMPGLEFLADGTSLAHSLLLNGPSNVIVGGAQSNSIDSAITGVGSLTKLGTGTLTLNNAGNSYSGGTFVNEGRLTLGAGTAILAGTDVTVAAGAEFNTGGQSNSAATAIGSVVLNGGTLRASSGSGDYYVNQLQMTSGAVDFSGSTAFGLHVVNPAGITVNAGASSWIGGGTSSILNDTAGPLPITVNPGGDADRRHHSVERRRESGIHAHRRRRRAPHEHRQHCQHHRRHHRCIRTTCRPMSAPALRHARHWDHHDQQRRHADLRRRHGDLRQAADIGGQRHDHRSEHWRESNFGRIDRRIRSRRYASSPGNRLGGQSGYEHVDVARQQHLHRHHLCEQSGHPRDSHDHRRWNTQPHWCVNCGREPCSWDPIGLWPR